MMQSPLQSKKILSYDDVVSFAPGVSNEQLVDVRTYDPSITARYLKADMLDITGDIIYVRDTLAIKLAEVNKLLNKSGFNLKVAYGYRHPNVQTKYFLKRRTELHEQHPDLDDTQLDRLTHNFVAIPSLAGHTAAAAVDLTIVDTATGLDADMGTGIADYSDPELIQTFDKRINDTVHQNRIILHDAMVSQDFAPFYGEWWHFSYGDREWAAFYNTAAALYDSISFSASEII